MAPLASFVPSRPVLHSLTQAASGQGGTLAFPVSPHLHRENMWGVSLLVQAQVGGGTMIILSKSSLRVVLVNCRALMASLEAG